MDIENLKNNLEVLFLNDHIDRYAFELLETIANNAQALQLLQPDVIKSVLLSGKCLLDYENGVIPLINNLEEKPITDNLKCLEWIDQSNNLIKIEHYILWFDSIGITVDIMPRMNEDKVIFEPNTFCLKYEITTEDFVQFDNRLDAKIKAIEKANEIYNEYFV